MKVRVLILWVLCSVGLPVGAQQADAADPLGIAAVLIRDGNYARAELVLKPVNPSDKGVDKVRYYTLTGLVALRSAQYAEAEAAFRQAKALGQKDNSLDPYLIQAVFAQNKDAEALTLMKGFTRLNAFPDLLGMKAQAEWNQGLKGEAVGTLDRATRLFPKQLGFLQTKIAFMLELSLTQEAADLARQYLDRAGLNPSAWLTIGESLRRGRQADAAISVLETARLAFPANLKVKHSLAQAYLDKGLVRTAAVLMEEAGFSDPASLVQAVELYKKAKAWSRALYLNGMIDDSRVKTRQRFSILVDAQRFEEASVLVPRLDQLGLLTEPRLQYAAAYSLFKVQRFDASQGLLSSLQDPTLFSASVQLRKAIEASRAEKTLYF